MMILENSASNDVKLGQPSKFIVSLKFFHIPYNLLKIVSSFFLLGVFIPNDFLFLSLQAAD